MGTSHALVIVLLPELAGPWDVVIIGLVGGMLLFVLDKLLRDLIIPAIRLIPVVGRGIADGLTDVINAVERMAYQWAEARLLPLTNTIRRIDNRLRSMARANTLTHQAALAALRRIRYDDLPRVIITLVTFVQSQTAAIIALAQALNSQTRQLVDARLALLLGYVLARSDQLQSVMLAIRAESQRGIANVADYARQLTQVAILRADAETERAIRAAAAEDATVAAYARSLTGQAMQYTQQQVQVAQQQATLQNHKTLTEVATLGAGLTTMIATMGSGLGGRIRNIENSSCQQECEPLGKLGKELRALDLALLLALVAACVAKPVESAGVAAAMLGPVSEQVVGLTDAVIGVR